MVPLPVLFQLPVIFLLPVRCPRCHEPTVVVCRTRLSSRVRSAVIVYRARLSFRRRRALVPFPSFSTSTPFADLYRPPSCHRLPHPPQRPPVHSPLPPLHQRFHHPRAAVATSRVSPDSRFFLTPSEGVPQMCISPTPSEGVNFANPRRRTSYGHSVLIPPPNSFQRSAANVHFPYSFRRSERWDENAGKWLTFGRWDENAVKRLTFGRWVRSGGRKNAAAGSSRGGGGSAHLRKVGRKCVEMTHLRKVGMVWGVGKCGCRRLSGRWCLCAPSEGETKMRGNDSPSEGGHGVGCWKMRLQAALVAVVVQRTFGRCGGGRVGWFCWFGD